MNFTTTTPAESTEFWCWGCGEFVRTNIHICPPRKPKVPLAYAVTEKGE